MILSIIRVLRGSNIYFLTKSKNKEVRILEEIKGDISIIFVFGVNFDYTFHIIILICIGI